MNVKLRILYYPDLTFIIATNEGRQSFWFGDMFITKVSRWFEKT